MPGSKPTIKLINKSSLPWDKREILEARRTSVGREIFKKSGRTEGCLLRSFGTWKMTNNLGKSQSRITVWCSYWFVQRWYLCEKRTYLHSRSDDYVWNQYVYLAAACHFLLFQSRFCGEPIHHGALDQLIIIIAVTSCRRPLHPSVLKNPENHCAIIVWFKHAIKPNWWSE